MVDTGKQILCVCYVENYSSNFKPYLVMVTEESIELLAFKKKDFSGSPELKSEISKENYELYKLAESEYEPIALELGEVVTKIVQVQKTGRILFASHLESYTNSSIKELHLDGQDNRYLTSLLGGLSTVVGQISRLAVSVGIPVNTVQQNKRLKSSYPREISQSTGLTVMQKVIPSALTSIFNDKRVAVDL
jgi:hypothetical protein